jgi:hypothetical protein
MIGLSQQGPEPAGRALVSIQTRGNAVRRRFNDTDGVDGLYAERR